MVIDTLSKQAFVGALRVVQCCAIAAAGIPENLLILIWRKFAAKAWALLGQGKGESRHLTLGRGAAKPARIVNVAGHFSVPQVMKCLACLLLRDAKRHTLATAAGEKGKHEARALRRASVDSAPHLQGAMPTMNSCRATLDKFKLWAPYQGCIAEYPQVPILS